MNGRKISDLDLLRQIQLDNQQALLTLMKKYDKSLFRYIYSKTGSSEAAEEHVQDIFLSLWNNRYTISIDESFSYYLFRAAKNKVVDFYIVNTKNITSPSGLLTAHDCLTAPSPEQRVIETELNKWFDQEVDNMPENIRNVFRLSRIEKLPVKEIADKLSLSEQTVKNNLSIAVKRMYYRFKKMENTFILTFLCILVYFQS